MLITELNELRRELKVLKLNVQRGPHLRSDSGVNKEVESSYTRINELQLELEIKEFKRLIEQGAERAKFGVGDNADEKLKAISIETSDISKCVSSELVGSGAQSSQDTAVERSDLQTALGDSQIWQPEMVIGVDCVSEHDQGSVIVETSK